MNRLGTLFLNSITEQERFSPRLISNFVFVGLLAYLVVKGANTLPKVESGIVLTGWAPEYVFTMLGTIIFGIFGLGKLPEIAAAFTSKSTVVNSDTTKIDTAGGQVVNNTPSEALAGYDDGPSGLRPPTPPE